MFAQRAPARNRGSSRTEAAGTFEVSNVKVNSAADGYVALDIFFSKSVNPETVNSRTIQIDGVSSGRDVNYTFSKRGNTVRIVFKAPGQTFSVKISNVMSADGEKIASRTFRDLGV